jgi:nucleotide-binding universal stress UspA family protein
VVAVTDLLDSVVVPVASLEDARATSEAVLHHIADAGGDVVVVHVVEKAGGAPDKASVEQRELAAEDAFDAFADAAADAGVDVERDLRYATDVVDGIFEAARDHDASAVAFTPRGDSRWLDLLTGGQSRALVKRAQLPVVVFPEGTNE